jgi:hypothetical protein
VLDDNLAGEVKSPCGRAFIFMTSSLSLGPNGKLGVVFFSPIYCIIHYDDDDDNNNIITGKRSCMPPKAI